MIIIKQIFDKKYSIKINSNYNIRDLNLSLTLLISKQDVSAKEKDDSDNVSPVPSPSLGRRGSLAKWKASAKSDKLLEVNNIKDVRARVYLQRKERLRKIFVEAALKAGRASLLMKQV